MDFDDDDEETISVNPEDLRFTQDSIAVCFQSPYEDYRIDQTVDMIVSKKLSPKSFPMLNVVRYKGNLWCLDNRRLWVFRKARVASITVTVDPSFEAHQRFLDIKFNTSLMKRWSAKNYFPRVRGDVREYRMKPTPTVFQHSIRRKASAASTLQSPACCRASDSNHSISDIECWTRSSVPNYIPPLRPQALWTMKEFSDQHAGDGRLAEQYVSSFSGPDRDSKHKQVRDVSQYAEFPAFQLKAVPKIIDPGLTAKVLLARQIFEHADGGWADRESSFSSPRESKRNHVRFNVSREDAEFPASHEPKSVPEIPRLSVRALLQARKRSEHADDGLADLHVSSFSAHSRDSEHNQVTRNASQDAKFAPSQPKSKPIWQHGPVHGGSSASSLNCTDMAENSKASDIEDYSVIPQRSLQLLNSLISLLKAAGFE